jgi:hypothetical protein
MKLPCLTTLFLSSIATVWAQDMSMMPELTEAMELRRNAGQTGGLDCQKVTVLLTAADVQAGQFTELTGIPKPFDRQGGVIQLSDPDDASSKIGNYSFLITFLDNSFGCIANGAYTFDNGDQVTFTAACSGLPFFSSPVAWARLRVRKALSSS